MAEYINVKIIGVDPVSAATNVIARASTGDGSSATNWQLLNVHSLGNFWIHSLSGGLQASATATSACAGTSGATMTSSNLVGTYGRSASGVALTAAAFLPVQLDNGQMFMIPLLFQPNWQ